MSVTHHLSVAPRSTRAPSPDQFLALLDDLIDADLVPRGVYVLSGNWAPSTWALARMMSDWENGQAARRARWNSADLAVRYAGRDREQIRSAVRTAPFEHEDVCVYFDIWLPGPSRPEMACDAAMFATREPRTLRHAEPFVLYQGNLFSYDPDDPEDRFVNGAWPPELAYPVRRRVGHSRKRARWFLSVDGGHAWDIFPAALEVCVQHFGEDHFAAYEGR